MAFGNTRAAFELFSESVKNGNGRIKSLKDTINAATVGVNWWAVGIGAAITAISLINAGIKKYKENLREAAQESAKQAEESARAVESLTELKTQLEDGSKSTDELTTAFKEQLKQMGYAEAGIDNLIKKYGGLEEAIKGTTEEVLAKNQADARAAKDDAKKSALTELGELVEGFTYEGGFIRLAFSVDNWIPEDIGQYSKEIQDEFQKFYDLGENADSTQNIDDLLAYYNQAQKVLDLLKNAAIDDEDIYNESAYLQAKSAVDKLSASMDGYANAITRVHEADAQIELSNFLKTNDIATKEDFDAYIKGVEDGTIGMVDGKEASDAYKQVLIDVANDAFPQFSNAAKEAGKNANEMTVSLSELKSASDNISTLQKAFKELSDDGYITTSTLSEIQEATKLSGDEWDKYQTKLMSVKVGSADYNQIMAELTHKILDNTFAGKDLNDVTEDQIEAVLRENGVVNASAVAHDWLTKKKQEEKAATVAAQIAEGNFEGTLEDVASQCGLTTSALATMILKMINLNETKLNLSQQIAEIMKLRAAMDLSTTKLTSEEIYGMGVVPKQGTSGKYGYSYKGKWYNTYNELYKDVLYDKTMGDFGGEEEIVYTPPVYTDDTSKSNSDSNKPDYEDPTDAIINRINLRADELAQQEEEIQNLIEIAELENDYKKQISLTNDLIDKRKERIAELENANWWHHNEAEYQRSIHTFYNEDGTESDENLWFDSQGNATEYYNALINKKGITKEEREAIKDLFERLSKYKKAYTDNSKEISETNKEILQDEEKIWDLRREEFDDRLEESEYYIQHSNDFGWENGDNEVKARKRVLEWIQSDYYRSLIKDDEEYYKILEEHRLNYLEAQRDEFEKATDFASSYFDSQKILLQSYYDVTNSIAEAQHEINKELEASKTMYEYLDEDTRKLLFNQEDYNSLSKELIDIQSEADRLKRQYEYDLDNATLDTVEKITSNYEMQYDMLMKSYEIAKADLEIAKKKQKLNNVLAERNVRMFIDGQWKWISNTQDVIDAKSELADAEYAKRTAEAGLRQTESINELTAKQDHLGTIISKFENGVITLGSALNEVVTKFKDLPSAVLNSLTSLQHYNQQPNKSNTYSAPPSNPSSGGGGGSSGGGGASGSSGKNATATIPGIGTVPVEVRDGNTLTTGLPPGTVVHTAGGDFKIKSGDGGNYITPDEKHASGTRYTPGGLTELGEKGSEMFIDNNGHLIPINHHVIGNLGAGGIVFNQDQMDFVRNVWDWANIGGLPNGSLINNTPHTITSTTDNRIIINGMTIDGNSSDGRAVIEALRRVIANH